MADIKVEGGCMCGAVRYKSGAQPMMQVHCHCTDCQRSTGGAYATLIAVPEEGMEMSGELRYHEATGESGHPVARGFCPSCGSPILSRASAFAGLLFIKAGTLDDASGVQPEMQIWTDSKQPWSDVSRAANAAARNPG